MQAIIETVAEFLSSLLVLRLPANLTFPAAAAGMFGLGYIFQKQKRRWVRTIVPIISYAIGGVLLSYSLAIWTHSLSLETNLAPTVKVDAAPDIVEVGNKSRIVVKAIDPEGTTSVYRYNSGGIGGQLPTGWRQEAEVEYVAPDRDGDAFIIVEAKDGARFPRIGKGDKTIRVVGRGKSEPAKKSFKSGNDGLGGGDYARAFQFFNETTRVVPSYSPAYIGLGASLAARGEWTSAIPYYDAATKYDPRNSFAYLLRAQAYEMVGTASEANRDVVYTITEVLQSSCRARYDFGASQIWLKS